MSLYPFIILLGCFLYVTAFPEPDPVYDPRYPPRVIRPTYNPKHPPRVIRPTYNPRNPIRVIKPTYNRINPTRINRPTWKLNKPIPYYVRVRRFIDGRQHFDGQNPTQQKIPDWEIKPDLSRDERGNTRGQVTIQKHGENHDLEAGWGQNIRGADKHSGIWHAGSSIRW